MRTFIFDMSYVPPVAGGLGATMADVGSPELDLSHCMKASNADARLLAHQHGSRRWRSVRRFPSCRFPEGTTRCGYGGDARKKRSVSSSYNTFSNDLGVNRLPLNLLAVPKTDVLIDMAAVGLLGGPRGAGALLEATV